VTTPPQEDQGSPLFWFIAGEESGDARAAEVMRELRTINPDLRFAGSGGPRMASFGSVPFDNWIHRAGVLGLWDVLKRYPYFRKKFSRAIHQIEEHRPDAVILVDYPGFNLRLAAALRKRMPELKILYYISPQVWAWNRGRIPKMARVLDLMVCIFPFEKPLYEASGLHTEFVGHPLVEELARQKSGRPRDEHLVGLFPGSREREIRRIFPDMVAAARIVKESRPDVRFAAAAATEEHAHWMQQQAERSGVPIEISAGRATDLMQQCACAIICSGTATLEATILGLPYCLVYKVNWLTFQVGIRIVSIRMLGIANILAGRPVVREFIQGQCTPFALADETLRFLNSVEARQQLTGELASITQGLGGEGAAAKAAEVIYKAANNSP
jgi:lipid-A-disaccharide synthase